MKFPVNSSIIRKAAATAVQPAASISNAALSAAVATSHSAMAVAQLLQATPVPKRRSVSPDPTFDHAGRSTVVSPTLRIPEDAILTVIANFDIRFLIPGVGAGAGGELERTLNFSLLHDPTHDKFLVHMQATGTYLTVQNPERFTVHDLMHTFFRGKPITLCNLPMDQLDTLIADLKQVPRSLNWSLRAY